MTTWRLISFFVNFCFFRTFFPILRSKTLKFLFLLIIQPICNRKTFGCHFAQHATLTQNRCAPQCLFSSKIWQNRPFLSDFFIDIWPFLTKIFNFRVIFCLKTLVYSTKFFLTYRRMEKTNDFIHYTCIYCLNQFFINKI